MGQSIQSPSAFALVGALIPSVLNKNQSIREPILYKSHEKITDGLLNVLAHTQSHWQAFRETVSCVVTLRACVPGTFRWKSSCIPTASLVGRCVDPRRLRLIEYLSGP